MLDQNIIAPTFVINDFYKFKEYLHSIEALFKSFMDKAYVVDHTSDDINFWSSKFKNEI